MTSQRHFVSPPRLAAWLVNLFNPGEEAESILGDLLEEYSYLATKSGAPTARRWYWRQTMKTIAHLAAAGFLIAPGATAAAVAGGFLLSRFAFGLPERAIFAVLEKYRVFDYHFSAYVFLASTGIAIGQVIASLFIGGIVALAAKGREMITTLLLSLVLSLLSCMGILVALAVLQKHLFLWTLPWQFASWTAIVIGGGIVRTLRAALRTRPAHA
jgi:hypothetical protein